MIEIMNKQNEILAAAMESKGHQRSAVRVEPRLKWPTLGDDNTGGQDAEDLSERFEEYTDLANSGKGMNPKELMISLKTSLFGSQKKIFENA